VSKRIFVKNGIRLRVMEGNTFRVLGAATVRVRKPIKTAIIEQPVAPVHQFAAAPPRLGEFLVCIFVPLDKQMDRLGDFEERFNTLWLPRFGARVARIIYITHAVRSAVTVFRLAAVAAVVDRVMGVFHW